MVAHQKFFSPALAFLAGILAVFAFAPFHASFLAIISTALLLLSSENAKPKAAFFRGWLYGLGFFGFGTSWVFISVHRFGGASVPLSILVTFLLMIVLGIFIGTQLFCWKYLFREKSKISLLVGFPVFFALFEWIRTWFLTGFPWLLIGYSQVDGFFRGFIPLLGSYGMCFLIAFLAALLVLALQSFRKERCAFILSSLTFLLLLIIAFFLQPISWTEQQLPEQAVSLVQGNIPLSMKWSSEQVKSTLDTYFDLNLQAMRKNNLVVFPETAIPIPPNYAKNYIDALSAQLKPESSAIISGIPLTSADGENYYNAAIGIGQAKGTYSKRHLVPFGEVELFGEWFQKLIALFNLPLSNLLPGEFHQPLIEWNGVPLGVFICYEIAYPDIIYEDLPQAQLLILLSDDSWFGDSFALGQHLQIAQFRARETGRMLLAVSNSGLTAIVDDHGQVLSQLKPFEKAILMGSISFYKGKTPVVQLGTIRIITFFFLLLIVAIVSLRFYRRKEAIAR